MQKSSVFLLLCLMFSQAAITAAQLSDDQQALLDTVQAALEAREEWETYSASTLETSNFALTLSGGESERWQTDTLTRATVVTYDLPANSAEGQISFQQNSAGSDAERQTTRQQIAFAINDDEVLVGVDDEPQSDVSDDLDAFAVFELAEVADFDARFPISPDLLDHTAEVFDLGVSSTSNRQQIQQYEITLDFATSLPDLEFNLDEFVNQFNGTVELRALTDAIIANSTLTLRVSTSADTGQLLGLVLALEIPVELEGDAVIAAPEGDRFFALEYGWQQQITYNDVNSG